MAYNEKHLAKLADLKALGTKQKEVADALAVRVDTLEKVGSQANVLEGVKVNGTALAIANKMVDILIATGSKNGSISVNGADVAIKGLAALAFKANVSTTRRCCSHRQVRTMSRVWGRHAPTRSLRKCRRIAEVKSRMDRKFSRIENLWPRDGSCPLPLRSKPFLGNCFRIVKTQK